MAVRSLFTASMAASLFSSTIHANLFARTDYPAEPPCAYPFTSFLYAGCYEDHNHQTLNYNPRLDSQDMTVQKCTASCKANGFRYAGLEYYGECFCGTTVKGAATTQDQCTFPCTGNNDETCGGSDRLSIYMDPTFPPIDETTIVDYSPLGCYTEGYSGRAVAYRQEQLSTTTLTTETCLQACKDGNYPLAATEYAGECVSLTL
ncbi:hypothetical protein MMC24_003252 [Lignoscripta atroalba]|nr:hypothetical protein [Lignoscripta atroalba]